MGTSATLQRPLDGRYVIARELGRGGTATVYLARDVKHDRLVALKVLHPELVVTEVGAERFLREIRLTAKLQHPHILPVLDSGHADRMLYYAMPYVDGETLRERLARERQLPLDDALRITREVADALTYAHARGLIHRDIKPENILLAKSGGAEGRGAGDTSGGGAQVFLVDFGIARAVDSATMGERMTTSGIVRGTPAYMSPEQASGDHALDARSDIYSLGCVVYEMIAGMPPFAGPTPQAVIAQRFKHTPHKVQVYRDTVPPHVEAAIERAMAIAPADRFATATDFADALETPWSDEYEARKRRLLRARQASRGGRRGTRAAILGAGAALVALGAVGALVARARRGPELEASRYVVLPFAAAGGDAQGARLGEQAALRLHDALERWRDIALVADVDVSERLARRRGTALGRDEALSIARELRAGQLVWGGVRQDGDSVTISAALYDVASGTAAREVPIRVARDLSDATPKLRQASVTLLRDTNARATSEDADDGAAAATTSLTAWRAYMRGRGALADWDLARAEQELRAAVGADPDYPQAHLRLAQVLSWRRGDAPDEWRDDALRAVSLRARLAARDTLLAHGLAALARGEYPAACQWYERLRARDSTDVLAWFGLGECQRRDPVVLVDRGSPSGWRFRTSMEAALRAYARSIELEPRAASIFRFRAFINFAEGGYRVGRSATDDGARFGAFAALDHDTLAFTPYPLEWLFAGDARTLPGTSLAGIQRSKDHLLRFAAIWSQRFPRSAQAKQVLARSLELRGELAPVGSGALSAVDVIREARRLSTQPEEQLEMAVTEVRLLVKRAEFARARDLADSLLRVWTDPTPDQASKLAGSAALIGQLGRATDLVRRAARSATPRMPVTLPVSPPPAVTDAAAGLFVHAALGACTDSLSLLGQQVDRVIESYVDVGQRERMHDAVAQRALSMAVPCLGPAVVLRVHDTNDRLVRMQQAFARHDLAAVRAHFDTLRSTRTTLRPGDVSLDYTYQEASLLAAMGDTIAAIRHLDLPLGALPTLGTFLVDEVPEAAALGRAMALRAELAARGRDVAAARRWAGRLATLWQRADAPLRPIVERMHALADAGGR